MKVYEGLKQLNNLHWFCDSCNPNVDKFLNDIARIEKQQVGMNKDIEVLQDKVERVSLVVESYRQDLNRKLEDAINCFKQESGILVSNVDNLKKSFESQKTEISEVRKSQVDFRDENQVKELSKTFLKDGLWTDVVRTQVDLSIGKVTGDLDNINKLVTGTKHHAEEEIEKERRSKNFIIYRVAEGVSPNFEERLKHDKSLVCHLLQSLVGDDFEEKEIIKMFRMGQRSDDVQKPRPLLVQLESKMTKNLLMNNLYKLKNSAFKDLVISHDMTLSEREQCKTLVKEAKDKEAADKSGEWIYRVRGLPGQMKVVRWRKLSG